jgi:hypothetical protein
LTSCPCSSGVSLGRAELDKGALVNYIGARRVGKLGPVVRAPQLKGAKAPAGSRNIVNLLCPDRKTFDRYVVQLLGPFASAYYEAVAALEFTPAWLGFLQAQELITAEQRAAVLADLRKLVTDAAPLWEQRGADPVVGAMIREAWERAGG